MTQSTRTDANSPDIVLRKGAPEDAEDFARLVNLGYAHIFKALYGISTIDCLKGMFCLKKNHLSFEHSYFAEVNGRIAGIIMGVDLKTRKQGWMRTRILMLRYIGAPFLVKMIQLLKGAIKKDFFPGTMGEEEYYFGYLVVYPQFRGLHLGKKLIAKVEDIAREMGAVRIVGDVEVENEVIIKIVKELGYTVEENPQEMTIGRDRFAFFKIYKDL